VTKNKSNTHLISPIAIAATTYLDMFNLARLECEHHAMNNLTKNHNCFHGNTKTECNHILCPLKGDVHSNEAL